MTKMRKLIFFSLIFLTACGPSTSQREDLVLNHATYDLSCPREKINITTLHEDSDMAEIMGSKLIVFSVEGCNKKQIYDNVGTSVYKSYDKAAINK